MRRWWLLPAILLLVLFSSGPLLWELLTAFKTDARITSLPLRWLPEPWTLEQFRRILALSPSFGRYAINSLAIASGSTLLTLVCAAPCAYVLARLRPRGSGTLVTGLVAVTLFPYVLVFLGMLELVQWLGWGNNYLALIGPYAAINLPLTILVLRSFFEQIPSEIEDAARVDGYRPLQLLLRILLPLAWPALATTALLSFIFAWNEYLFALSFISRQELKTLPVAVAELSGTTLFDLPYGAIAAATLLATLPLVALVLVFQRRIIEGLTAGAVKG